MPGLRGKTPPSSVRRLKDGNQNFSCSEKSVQPQSLPVCVSVRVSSLIVTHRSVATSQHEELQLRSNSLQLANSQGNVAKNRAQLASTTTTSTTTTVVLKDHYTWVSGVCRKQHLFLALCSRSPMFVQRNQTQTCPDKIRLMTHNSFS